MHRKPYPGLSNDGIGQIGALIALICFVLAVPASPFKSKSRLEAENAALRHQLIVVQRKMRPSTPGHEKRSLVLDRDLPMVPVVSAGPHDHRSRNAGALASGRLSPLLALEIALAGRAPANRCGTRYADPADEYGKPALGCAAHPRRIAQLWFGVGQATVATYMVKRRGLPSQGWRTFLRNRTPHIAGLLRLVSASMRFCLRPTRRRAGRRGRYRRF